MIILIGGESHTGKTFLAQRLLERYSFPYFSLDHLKMGLIRGLADCGFTAESPDALISEKMWRIVEGIVVTCVENGQNLIIEGCYLPPERVRLLLSGEVVAVYLGFSEAYLSKNFDALWKYENVVEHRKFPEDRPLEAFIAGNARVRSACAAWGLPYFEAGETYEKMQKDAIAFLDGKAGLTGAKMNKTEAGMRLSEYEVAEDMLIDGLKIVQDTRLYRFTSDSVLLSRFARAKAGDKVADFCAGSGIVAFHFYALHRALKGLDFTLFEMQRQLSELSVKTAALNGFGNFEAVNCKIQEMPETYREKFSLVRGGFSNDDYKKAICRKEITINLAEIARAAAFALRFGGRLALVNRADRLAEVCYTLHEAGIEVKRVQFVAGKAGAAPYLLMAEGVKGGRPHTELLPTLINKKD